MINESYTASWQLIKDLFHVAVAVFYITSVTTIHDILITSLMLFDIDR